MTETMWAQKVNVDPDDAPQGLSGPTQRRGIRDDSSTFYTRRVGEVAFRLTVERFHNGEIMVFISAE